MAADPGPLTAAAGGDARKGRGWRIFRIILIGAVVSVALLIAFPPVGLIKDELARAIGASIGRTVTIGDARLKFWKTVHAEFDQVSVSGAPGKPDRPLFNAATVKTDVELLPLLKGRINLISVALVEPVFTLEEDADGVRNWVFTPEPGAGKGPAVRSPTSGTIERGALTFASAKTGAKRAASDINADITRDAISGALDAKGQLVAGKETVRFDVGLGDLDAAIAGRSSPLRASMDARPLKADIAGDALFAAAAEFAGSLTASSPSLLDLARWLGADATPSGEPLKTSLAGTIKATTRDVSFADTDVMINTTSSRFNGALDLGGPRPKLTGDVASAHVDLGRMAGVSRRMQLAPEAAPTAEEALVVPGWEQLLADLRALEEGPAVAAEAERQSLAATATAAPAWSEQPFNLNALKALDLDVAIKADEIAYGGLDLKNARVKAAVTDGLLDAKLESLDIGAGKAAGTVNIDSRATPPRATVALNLTDVAAEPVITEITGKPLLSGTSNVEISASAAGQNQSQLTSTLEGKARFRMGKGAVRGFDVRRMISEWWKSWKYDLAMKTGFERLEAQYDIKKGVLRSQPDLSIGGGDVEINSVGFVNVPAKRLNQEIRIKVVPPPTALPVPVRISGDWAKPSIGIDWGGLFSAAPSFGEAVGGPQGIAPATEAPPASVQAAIRRVLAADLPPERLSPEARQMLQSLLPPEQTP